MKSKLENMERKLADKGGSILPSIDVNKDPFPEKKRGQGARGQSAGRKWGRGRGAGQPFQQSKQQGYESKQQGYESKQQWFQSKQQGYESKQQGFQFKQQGYESKQQGYESKQQGYESKQQGYKSPRQHSPGQRFKQEQVSTKPSNQTFNWSGSNDQDLLPDRQWGQPALGKFEPSWSYDHGLVAGEPRAASGQGQLGRGSGGAGRDGGNRGRGKARNKSDGKLIISLWTTSRRHQSVSILREISKTTASNTVLLTCGSRSATPTCSTTRH
ncbi:uncharacterized protein LOC127838686 [Dreissena polymorpha]|uniref:uncharacterized protein LOC127838686 n=1 Tax=Dreissena polymorpha TaxID=45954 RepID=UPI00226455D1|nr:uncharacterized protein LOC127838686 [Dreissena polymorpha]